MFVIKLIVYCYKITLPITINKLQNGQKIEHFRPLDANYRQTAGMWTIAKYGTVRKPGWNSFRKWTAMANDSPAFRQPHDTSHASEGP